MDEINNNSNFKKIEEIGGQSRMVTFKRSSSTAKLAHNKSRGAKNIQSKSIIIGNSNNKYTNCLGRDNSQNANNISGGNKSGQHNSEQDADEISSLTTDTEFRNIAINTDYSEIGVSALESSKLIKYSYYDLKGVNYIMFPMYGILEQGIQTELTMNDISRLEEYQMKYLDLNSNLPKEGAFALNTGVEDVGAQATQKARGNRCKEGLSVVPFSSTQYPQFKSNIKRETLEPNIGTHTQNLNSHTNIPNIASSFSFAYTPAENKSVVHSTRTCKSSLLSSVITPITKLLHTNNNNSICNNSIMGPWSVNPPLRARKDPQKGNSSAWADMDCAASSSYPFSPNKVYICRIYIALCTYRIYILYIVYCILYIVYGISSSFLMKYIDGRPKEAEESAELDQQS